MNICESSKGWQHVASPAACHSSQKWLSIAPCRFFSNVNDAPPAAAGRARCALPGPGSRGSRRTKNWQSTTSSSNSPGSPLTAAGSRSRTSRMASAFFWKAGAVPCKPSSRSSAGIFRTSGTTPARKSSAGPCRKSSAMMTAGGSSPRRRAVRPRNHCLEKPGSSPSKRHHSRLAALPMSSRRLFITTITVLPSWPITPSGRGMPFPAVARMISTATVPSDMTRF